MRNLLVFLGCFPAENPSVFMEQGTVWQSRTSGWEWSCCSESSGGFGTTATGLGELLEFNTNRPRDWGKFWNLTQTGHTIWGNCWNLTQAMGFGEIWKFYIDRPQDWGHFWNSTQTGHEIGDISKIYHRSGHRRRAHVLVWPWLKLLVQDFAHPKQPLVRPEGALLWPCSASEVCSPREKKVKHPGGSYKCSVIPTNERELRAEIFTATPMLQNIILKDQNPSLCSLFIANGAAPT